MFHKLMAAGVLSLAMALPLQDANARGRGGNFFLPGAIIAGTIIAAGTAAAIMNSPERRYGEYYWWHHACYYQREDGVVLRVDRDYCRD